jgi:hypothetical protein
MLLPKLGHHLILGKFYFVSFPFLLANCWCRKQLSQLSLRRKCAFSCFLGRIVHLTLTFRESAESRPTATSHECDTHGQRRFEQVKLLPRQQQKLILQFLDTMVKGAQKS